MSVNPISKDYSLISLRRCFEESGDVEEERFFIRAVDQ
jgi:hypothetical protein